METLLIIYFLNVESSYLQNTERHVSGTADTVQFLLVGSNAWRIKTYAIDHDVRVWSIGSMARHKFENLANQNTEEHYGDVLVKKIELSSKGDLKNLLPEIKKAGLAENLEVAKDSAFAFWAPEANSYKSRSTPK